MLAEVALFTVAVLVIFGIAGNEPTTLITEFFKFWGIEGGALGATKIAETIVENIPRRKEKQKSVDSTDETAI